MSIPIKAILAGVALAGVGGTGIWLLYSEGMPKWRPLSQDADIASNYEGKYGKTYARLLVGVGTAKTGEGVIRNNRDWWNWVYKNRYRSTGIDSGDGFGSIDSAKVDSGEKLKQKCEEAYKGTLNASGGNVSVSSKNYKEAYVWRFCSPLGQKPQTIGDDEKPSYAGKKANGKEGDLVSVKEGVNDSFWDIRNREFYGLDGFEKIAVASTDSYFSTEQNKPEKGRESIRSICKRAYEMSSTTFGTTENPTPDQIVKYCSIDLKTTSA